MKALLELMSCVWQEVSRHVEIADAAEQVERLLASEFSGFTLQIFRFDGRRHVLERAYPLHPGAESAAVVTAIDLQDTEEGTLVSWARTGGLACLPGTEDSAHACLGAILIRGGMPMTSSWLAVPLRDDLAFIGILVLCGSSGVECTSRQQHILERLKDPLSVALKNDWRLHELEILRNAAESEKLAVLRRLGRDRPTDDIIGVHAGLKPVIQRIRTVVHTDVPILLLGETGTGKEVIARLIHQQSTRADGPFLRVNSGAISPELIDTELFGHEKGAFTGATMSRRGWFERADGGTLLLDEIGELPKSVQVRLLRVLQEASFERVGGEKTIRVDVRVIAATHRDLAVMVQDGRFREDLWYRINGFPVILPPLRERKMDIPQLARHFAQRAARIFGLMPQLPSADDLERLMRYDWPGNIRELASVIDRAAILGEGHTLAIRRALGLASVVAGEGQPVDSALAVGHGASSSLRAIETLAEANRKHIRKALNLANGQIEGPKGAAALLDINPHTLRARMRKLGIDWRQIRAAHSRRNQ